MIHLRLGDIPISNFKVRKKSDCFCNKPEMYIKFKVCIHYDFLSLRMYHK